MNVQILGRGRAKAKVKRLETGVFPSRMERCGLRREAVSEHEYEVTSELLLEFHSFRQP